MPLLYKNEIHNISTYLNEGIIQNEFKYFGFALTGLKKVSTFFPFFSGFRFGIGYDLSDLNRFFF